MLRRSWIEFTYVAELGVAEVVWPPAFGVHHMQVSADLAPGPRRFALRHGLAHVLAGHTVGGLAKDGHDWHTFDETVADTFALIDVAPAWKLAQLREAGYDPETWLREEVGRWTDGWSAERVDDRVAWRLAYSP